MFGNKALSLLLWFLMLFSTTVLATPNTIYIIGTGGTIAGKAGSGVSNTYESGQLSAAQLLQDVPDLKKLAPIQFEDLLHIDSGDITIANWLQLAKAVNKAAQRSEVKGIVITHGTDTLEETAYFLSLVLKTKKPVVIVGAMRPASSLSADGPLNLYNAVAVAASPKAFNQGVLVIMNDQIFDAREVTKTNTTRTDTFASPNSNPIGTVNFADVQFYNSNLRKHTTDTPFDINNLTTLPEVEIIYEYAGTSGRLFTCAMQEKAIQGIVFAGTGDGNIAAPERDLLKQAIDKGLVIVRSSRTGSGTVTYDYVHHLDSQLGLVPADDLNPQKARILLMLALTKTHDPKVIRQYFLTY